MITVRTAWDRPSRPPDGVTEHVLLIGLKPQAEMARLPGNLCIVLDCSGSMVGQKLEDARAACRLAVQCLNPDDTLSLVTFNDYAVSRFAAQRRDALTDAVLEQHLAGIKAEGTTRVDLALAAARSALAPNVGSGRMSAILLITDGHPTDAQGHRLSEFPDLYEASGELASQGVATVTVGLGNARNYNSAFLTGLADRGHGRFCYAPEPSELAGLLQEQIRAAQAVVLTGLEIALARRMASARVTGFCRIAPRFIPHDVGQPASSGTWRIACGALGMESEDAETLFLARVEAQGMFGMSAGTYPVLAVGVSWQPAEGPRSSAPEAVASLRYTPALREQQEVTPQVQELRLRWEMNLWEDELAQTSDARRTGVLLDQIAEGAAGLGMDDVATQASAQRDHLRRTGQLDADNLSRTGQLLRAAGPPAARPEPGAQPRLGVGFGGGPDADVPAAAPARPAALEADFTALEVVAGRTPGTRFAVNALRMVLGRAQPPDAPVDIDLSAQEEENAPSVSRRHAELSWEGGRLFIRDLGSANGTYVNGQRLPSPGRGQPGEPRELLAGDEVKVASVALKVVTL